MGIIRVIKQKNFSTISNVHLNDTRLSLKAKGLQTVLLSKPDDWQVRVSYLIKCSKDGKDAHYSAIEELITFGYILKKAVRDPKGRFCGFEYFVYEKPIPEPDLPYPENPDTVNPDIDKPETENQKLLNTDKLKTNLNQKLIPEPQSQPSFQDLNLSYNNFAIQKLVKKYWREKGIEYVQEAVMKVNSTLKNKNARSYQSYLFKTLKYGWAISNSDEEASSCAYSMTSFAGYEMDAVRLIADSPRHPFSRDAQTHLKQLNQRTG